MNIVKKYIWNMLIALDQMGNALTGGDPDETISSRSAKGMMNGSRMGRLMCRFLDIFDKGHCPKAIEPDEGKNEL